MQALKLIDQVLTFLDSVEQKESSAPKMAAQEQKSDADYGRIPNFSAGPACLPLSVLEEVQKDLVNYKGSGTSVMEMSHRSKWYDDIWNSAKADLTKLLNIPDTYEIEFLQGGATTQFSAIPLNLNLRNSDKPADYVVSGQWSKKATQEAKRFGKVNVVFDGEGDEFVAVPPVKDWNLSKDAAYLHVCVNETVHGVMQRDFPKVDCPIIADFSSCFMSEPIDVTKFDMIYAGAQKNVGPAGVCVVIVKKELMGKADPLCPVLMKWDTWKANKIYNTPPTFAIYVMGLVFKWLLSFGTLEDVKAHNEKKAAHIYDAVERSNGFYVAPVHKDFRSLMNIRYKCSGGAELDKKFLEEVGKMGFQNLKGYRTLGGIRASCYNAQPMVNCEKLAKFMDDFRAANSK